LLFSIYLYITFGAPWCANNQKQNKNTMEKTQVDELSNQFVDRMVNNVALMLKYEQKEQYELSKQYNDVINDDIESYITILEMIFLESEDEKVNYIEVIERQKQQLIKDIRAEFEKNPDFLSE
jgi:N-acetyl-beta-hexosaminidase